MHKRTRSNDLDTQGAPKKIKLSPKKIVQIGVLNLIFHYLPKHDRAIANLVCKHWRRVLQIVPQRSKLPVKMPLTWELVDATLDLLIACSPCNRPITSLLNAFIENPLLRGRHAKTIELLKLFMTSPNSSIKQHTEKLWNKLQDVYYIHARVDNYLTRFFSLQSSDCIEIHPKDGGEAFGRVVHVVNETTRTKYNVKMHSNGFLSNHISLDLEDVPSVTSVQHQEMFVYKLLEYLELGPKCILFGEDQFYSYIATLDVAETMPTVMTYEQFRRSSKYKHLVSLFKQGGNESWNEQFENEAAQLIEGLTRLELVSKYLGIFGLFADRENFALCSESYGSCTLMNFNIMITPYRTNFVFDIFKDGSGIHNIYHSDPIMWYVKNKRDMAERLKTAQHILASLTPKLDTAMQKAQEATLQFFSQIRDTEELEQSKSFIDNYCKEMKTRFEELCKVFQGIARC